MESDRIEEILKEIVSQYFINKDNLSTTTNLLGIMSVRNIIYILIDVEKKFNIKIDDEFIEELRIFSIANLSSQICKRTLQGVSKH